MRPGPASILKMTHLDAATLRGYREKHLAPAALLAVDEHLGNCDRCRKASLHEDGGAAADSILDALTGDDEHLEYDTLEAWVDGTLSPQDRRTAAAHLQHCAQCATDIADLRETAASIPSDEPARYGISLKLAAVLLVAIIGVASWFAIRHRISTTAISPVVTPVAAAPRVTINDASSRVRVEANGAIGGLKVSESDAAMLRDALERGQLDVSARATALGRERGTLMGSAGNAPFDVVSPVATFVQETRPHFAWTALPRSRDDAGYRVEVYDEAGHAVLESPVVNATEWTGNRDLPRGHEYAWQVVATRGGSRIVAPQPPSAEAHFGVIDASAAGRVAAAARTGSHLMFALAAAREGLVDDARRELAALERLNPDSPQVRALVRGLPH